MTSASRSNSAVSMAGKISGIAQQGHEGGVPGTPQWTMGTMHQWIEKQNPAAVKA
ncbi:hypothetical protein [Streptomyces sp. NPDC060333]|uniref:hypothetical protein n=1 Tax=Streptomyces sp. NPDC060333 TaxID=3347098 RepID=UPI00365FCADB